jgi:hypothetical protein
MQSFTFYIDDDRSAFTTRLPVRLPDDAAARARAQTMLGESEHYRGIEVFDAVSLLFRIGARQSSLGKRR